MCNEIFELIFDRIEEAQMRKRVDKEYKMYSVNNAIQFATNAITISEMPRDKGDELGNYHFKPYNYDEESEEPVPAQTDSFGKERKMGDPINFVDRFRMSHFNKTGHGARSTRSRASSNKKIGRFDTMSITSKGASPRGYQNNLKLPAPSFAQRQKSIVSPLKLQRTGSSASILP